MGNAGKMSQRCTACLDIPGKLQRKGSPRGDSGAIERQPAEAAPTGGGGGRRQLAFCCFTEAGMPEQAPGAGGHQQVWLVQAEAPLQLTPSRSSSHG
jgi:hypothetical protein